MNTLKRLNKKNSTVVLSYIIAIVMFAVVSLLRPEFASYSHIKIMLIDAAKMCIRDRKKYSLYRELTSALVIT